LGKRIKHQLKLINLADVYKQTELEIPHLHKALFVSRHFMKHYYYSDNEQQFGPFTLDELKSKRIRKSSLVWTDGFVNWTLAGNVDELKDILISEPPPLPQKEIPKQVEKVTITQTTSPTINVKFDSSYQKETDATFAGIFLFITPIIIQLTGIVKFENIDSYNEARMWISVETLAVRIGATAWVVNISKRQNRNSTGWGWLTFFFPGISLIIIGQLRKLKLKIEIDGSLPKSQQVSTLIRKANELYLENRVQETIEVLNKTIELDDKKYEAILLRAKSYYKIEEYENAKKDFDILKSTDQFSDQVYLHLGIIESLTYNYEKAIELWKISKEKGNTQAQTFLDRYLNYKGKYLLDENETNKKIGSKATINEMEVNGQCLKYLSGIVQADNIPQIDRYKTEIILYEYGFSFKMTKLFKSHQFSISYTEIEEVVKADTTLDFILFDKLHLSFHYDSRKDTGNILEQICNDFTNETGIELTTVSKNKNAC
jgi:tetratricopeptide (TPR) repeat protein